MKNSEIVGLQKLNTGNNNNKALRYTLVLKCYQFKFKTIME